jgi:hypothetical protein
VLLLGLQRLLTPWVPSGRRGRGRGPGRGSGSRYGLGRLRTGGTGGTGETDPADGIDGTGGSGGAGPGGSRAPGEPEPAGKGA